MALALYVKCKIPAPFYGRMEFCYDVYTTIKTMFIPFRVMYVGLIGSVCLVRKGFGGSCIPVVIATCGASQETMQYAKELGVELFLQEQADIVIRAKATGKAPYGSYGTFLKVLLYLCTKDTIWIDALPENRNTLSKISMTEQLLMDTKADFDRAQSYLDSADSMERRAREERQKALDIQKAAAYRAIQAGGLADNGRENHTQKEKPTVIEDSG